MCVFPLFSLFPSLSLFSLRCDPDDFLFASSRPLLLSIFLQTASYVLGLECLTSLIAGRLFREDLSPTKESWFDAVESFSPAGRILVNIGEFSYESTGMGRVKLRGRKGESGEDRVEAQSG